MENLSNINLVNWKVAEFDVIIYPLVYLSFEKTNNKLWDPQQVKPPIEAVAEWEHNTGSAASRTWR